MSDPARLHEDAATGSFERALLRSASLDREPDDGAARALAVLGIAAPSSVLDSGSATAPAGGSGTIIGAGGASVAAKLGGVLLVAGGVIAGTLGGSPSRESAPSPHTIASAIAGAPADGRSPTAPVVSEIPAPAAPDELRGVDVADLPSARSDGSSPPAHARGREPQRATPSVSARRGISEEIALIDRARAEISAGDTGQAKVVLDTYDSRFQDGELAIEAKIARIELHLARSEDARARDICERFLEEHPHTAYARRVRILLRRAGGEPIAR